MHASKAENSTQNASFLSRLSLVQVSQVSSRKEIRGHLFWFLAWLVITGIGIYLTPSEHGHGTHTQLGLPPCAAVLFCDRPCPGCGMTTSWTNILHGNLVQAFDSNLFGPILYLAFTISALIGGYGYVRKLRFDTGTHKMNVVLKIIAAGLIIYGVFRFSTTKLNSPHSMESLRNVSSSPVSKDAGDSTRVPKEDSP